MHARLAATAWSSRFGDLDRIDRAVLERYGAIAEIAPEQLRDPQLADRLVFGFRSGPP